MRAEEFGTRVMIAVDPHKASWTAAAVDASLQPIGTVRVPVGRDGYRALQQFARRWRTVDWAIEGATGLGATLTKLLNDDGVTSLMSPQSWPHGCGCFPPAMAAKAMTLTPSRSVLQR
jgi:transposase